jgi:hypothetical protein
MMTEAEALQTLAREDPAVAEDAKAALRWLTSGGGLEVISLLRLQEFLWCVLPTSWPATSSGHIAVAKALARLLTLAGMERYGDVCASEQTERIIAAYAEGHDHGVAAYSKALATSHAAPPDTDLLAWSSAMGQQERAAYDACAAAIELAVVAGDLRVGVSGWKTKRAGLVERWLTRPTKEPGTDTWLSRISAERIDEWAHGHPGERAQMARRVVPRLLEPPVLPGEPLPTLRWLLHHADAGLRLTARHYIAPALVGEAAGMFGWGTASGTVPGGANGPGAASAAGKRHQELDVYPLHTLRGLAQHEMGAVRRSGTSLVLTKTGRLMADDAAVRWHIGTAALIGPDDGPDPDFTVAVREAALLIATVHDGPVGYEELTSRLTELHAAEGWTSRSGSSLAGAIRAEIHVLRHRLRALQLLDEPMAAGPLGLALTGTGTAAALSALLARALRPRRHQQLGATRWDMAGGGQDRLLRHPPDRGYRANADRVPFRLRGRPDAEAAGRRQHRRPGSRGGGNTGRAGERVPPVRGAGGGRRRDRGLLRRGSRGARPRRPAPFRQRRRLPALPFPGVAVQSSKRTGSYPE